MIYCDFNAGAPIRPEVVEAMTHGFALGGNPSSVHGFGRRARSILETAREEVAALAGELELTALLKRRMGSLSAGQKTRVSLAKALVNEPEVLLLDEPTASLDPDSGDWVRSFLEAYRARSGAAILLASHNMAEVERLCDRVLMMRQGRIVDQGTPAALLSRYGRHSLEEVFLDIARERRREEAAE